MISPGQVAITLSPARRPEKAPWGTRAAAWRGRLAKENQMPLFGGGSGDTTTWEPQAADGRLAHTAGATPDGVFTSDLSVSEYALLGEAGFEPLGFVVGSSIFHIGIVGVDVAVSNHVWGEHATEFLATRTAIRRLSEEHRLPATTPKPTFTLGLDN